MIYRMVFFALIMVCCGCFYRLFLSSDGSLRQLADLSRQVELQKARNQRFLARNEIEKTNLQALHDQNNDAVELRARQRLGLIRPGETFYIIMQ